MILLQSVEFSVSFGSKREGFLRLNTDYCKANAVTGGGLWRRSGFIGKPSVLPRFLFIFHKHQTKGDACCSFMAVENRGPNRRTALKTEPGKKREQPWDSDSRVGLEHPMVWGQGEVPKRISGLPCISFFGPEQVRVLCFPYFINYLLWNIFMLFFSLLWQLQQDHFPSPHLPLFTGKQ